MADGWFSELSEYVADGEKPTPKRKLPRANQWWKNEFAGLFRVERTRSGVVHGHRYVNGGKYVRDAIEIERFLQEFSFLRSFKP
jgi:hypothetical protein